jgi:2-methylisocitrate lyase-like PEP mutase family enzyme
MADPTQASAATGSAADRATRFLDLHRPGQPLLLPNPWDRGSACVLASLGFEALATTSAGFAGTLGRIDGNVTRDEAISHARDIALATPLPVSADLENGFAREPEAVAETVRRAAEAGLSGCSIEDYAPAPEAALYDATLAAERIAAATEVSRRADTRIVLTARAENHLRGRDDLDDTIARLQAFERAGADVVYAPGLHAANDIRQVVEALGAPLNVLLLPGGPTVSELAKLGVARVSVGGAFHSVTLAALKCAALELKEQGTHGFWTQAVEGGLVARDAFE